MTITELLIEAKKLISNPENWIQTGFAKDQNNRPTEATASDAVKFCSVGAIRHAVHFCSPWLPTNAAYSTAAIAAVEALKSVIGVFYIYRWNDTVTHAQVMTAFDEAIKQAAA